MMLIDGFAIAGYRSFGRDLQYIGPFAKINLFIGPNNSGKSNILRLLSRHFQELATASENTNTTLEPFFDAHMGSGHCRFAFATGVRPDDSFFSHFESKMETVEEKRDFAKLLEFKSLRQGTGLIWSQRIAESVNGPYSFNLDPELKRALADLQWSRIWQKLYPSTRGGSLDDWVRGVWQKINPFHKQIPEINIIPAIRRIGEKGSKATDHSGIGIIERLAQLQNPKAQSQDDRKKFDAINHFLQTVCANNAATIEIPHDRDTILVHMNEKRLPIESLGTGIHEVVILAAAATVLSNQVLCIEEPEIHLHPFLQRALLNYLAKHTSNQYFITTHSAQILDVSDAAIFRVSHNGGQTIVNRVSASRDVWEACRDLGYRASDILQSNCIVWVEGPSDRVYLNHWIRHVDNSLTEGVHYSIMFYGGRLLCHLSADDHEVSEFISLCAINRNIALVIDSDKKNRSASINATKQRVEKEISETKHGFVWITEGREIENYVDADTIRNAVRTVNANLEGQLRFGKFKNLLRVGKKPNVTNIDKLKVAHEVANQSPRLDTYDLHSKVNELVSFIHKANT